MIVIYLFCVLESALLLGILLNIRKLRYHKHISAHKRALEKQKKGG